MPASNPSIHPVCAMRLRRPACIVFVQEYGIACTPVA
jgi:hypothetical protein